MTRTCKKYSRLHSGNGNIGGSWHLLVIPLGSLNAGIFPGLCAKHFLSGPQMHLSIAGKLPFRVQGAPSMVLRNNCHSVITCISNHRTVGRGGWVPTLLTPRSTEQGTTLAYPWALGLISWDWKLKPSAHICLAQ